MKKLLITILLFCSLYVQRRWFMLKLYRILFIFLLYSCSVSNHLQAQNYGDQSPITINGIVCLLHLPDTYNTETTKYPLLIMLQGAGEWGTNPNEAVQHGTGWAIKNNAWHPNSVHNFRTGLDEKFIVLSTLSPVGNSSLSFFQIDALYTYMRNNYRVDSNCMGTTGLSRGGAPAVGFGAHISGGNCCPPSYVFTTPKNILCAEVSMSPEILDSSQGVTQPVQFEVADSIPVWGWSDSNDCQGHGIPIKRWVQHVQRLAPTLGALYTYFHSNVQCHGGWDSIYTETTRQLIDGHLMNTYEWQLYNRRGAPVTPPTQTVSIGSIAQSSFCITPTQTAAFSVSYTSIGTFNAGNTFTVQMSDASGSFSSFQNVGSGTSPITVTIPANSPTGTQYKFRVQSSNPIVTSSPSPIKSINLAANTIVPSATQTVNINVSGNVLTVRDSSAGATHQWYNNSVAIAGQTSTTYTPLFSSVSVDTITCKSTFSCGTRTSNKVIINVVNPNSSKVYVTPNVGCGVYQWSFANPGDSLILDPTILGDTVCQLSFKDLHGTAAKHISISGEHGLLKSTAPLNLENCTYVDVNMGTQVGLPLATGSVSMGKFGNKAYSVPYGLEVFGALTGGGGFEVHGKCHNITASNIYVHDRGAVGGFAGYGIVMKNDPLTYGCDSSYDYPNTFDSITMHDFVFTNINKDVIYLGFSGGYNTSGQGVVCGGVTRYFRPAQIANLLMYNMYCVGALRSFIQGGQLAGGNCVFHDMYACNLGGDSLNGFIDGSQGAFAAFGIPDSSITMYNCGGNRTWLHNTYSYAYGTSNFFNNTFDSAGYFVKNGTVYTNPSQSTFAFFPKANTNNVPARFVIQNNGIGTNTANYNIRLDAGSSTYTTTGNVICNSGNVYNPFNAQYATCSPLNTITTKNISPTSFCVTPTVGANVTITFDTTGTFNANNVFTAYLSDPTGNFASQTAIGSSATKSISAIIPANIPYGSGYKIRVQSSNPVIVGTASNNAATINLVSNSIAPTATQTIYVDSLGDVLTVTDASPSGTHQWFSNNTAIAGQTSATYTPQFGSAGTYTVLEKTAYSCGVATSNSVTINVINLPPPPPDSLFTSTVSGSPFCVASGVTTSLNVSYTSNRLAFNSGNVFTVQLSNANGSFASPTTIGTSTSTLASGTIACVIPANTPTGTKYRIRVISSNPTATARNNGTNLIINLASNNITPTPTQNILPNVDGVTLNANETSTATGEWLYGNISGTYPTHTGITTKSFTPNFASVGSYFIVYQSVFACATDTSNEVLVNVADPNPPPPDTICTTTQIQHDTTFRDTQMIVTPRDSVVIDTLYDSLVYRHLARLKRRTPVHIITTKTKTYHLSDTTYRYFDTTVITPLHDTTTCAPSYRMGVFYFNIGVPITQQIDTVKNYIGVNYIRLNITRGASNWNVKQANDSGMHVLQGINNSPPASSGFAAYVQSRYALGIPELVTGQNEPTINLASQSDNLTDLQTLIDVSHPLGIKVADGGITSDVVYYMVDYWNTHGKTDSATWLRQTLGLNMSSPAALKAIGQYDTLLNAYRTMNLDYVNVHFYEPLAGNMNATTPTGLLPILLNFIAEQTGKPLMSNEYGTRNASCNLLTQLTLQGLSAGLKYMIYFDGNGSGGAIKNQDCFKTIIQNLQ